jgi:hypothetical protein
VTGSEEIPELLSGGFGSSETAEEAFEFSETGLPEESGVFRQPVKTSRDTISNTKNLFIAVPDFFLRVLMRRFQPLYESKKVCTK